MAGGKLTRKLKSISALGEHVKGTLPAACCGKHFSHDTEEGVES